MYREAIIPTNNCDAKSRLRSLDMVLECTMNVAIGTRN